MRPNDHIADIAYRAFMDLAALEGAAAFWVRFLDVMHGFAEVRANHRRVMELLGVRPGYALLDVGCGTGNVTRHAAANAGPEGRVVGCDLSEAMLGVASTRAAEAGLEIDYHLGLAQERTLLRLCCPERLHQGFFLRAGPLPEPPFPIFRLTASDPGSGSCGHSRVIGTTLPKARAWTR